MTFVTTTHADLIVIGAGLAGAATAYSAAKRGLDVVVLERFGPGHRNGSSHGSARIFRRAYPDPLYVKLTGKSGELWRRLAEESREQLLMLTGGLDFGANRNPAALHAVLTANGVPAELLTSTEAAERWPMFDFTSAGQVTFHPECGVLDPDLAMAAMLRLAAANGADIRFSTPAALLTRSASGDGAVAHTDTGSVTAQVAVIAAGAWLPELAAGLVELPPLRVTKQQIFHFAQKEQPGQATAARPWPVFICWDGTYFYGLPGGRDGGAPGAIKIGEHLAGTETTAATRDHEVDQAARDRVIAFVSQRVPGLDPAPFNEATCLYTWTANEDFILDRPASGPFVIASPCSGHGAKFAPLLGELITDLATGHPPSEPRFTLAAHLRASYGTTR
jgi:sarcosine oxidase